MQFYIGKKNYFGENILSLDCGEKFLFISNSMQRLPMQEIFPSQAKKILQLAEEKNLIAHHESFVQNNLLGLENFSLDYFDGENFKIEEIFIDTKNFSAENEILDNSTHYKIFAKNSSDALKIAKNFCAELYEKNLLVSKCANFIFAVDENAADDFNIENIFRQSAGGAVIIEGDEKIFDKLIKKFSDEVIFIFLEIDENFRQKNNSCETLQKLVGLTEIKKILSQILDNFKIQKLRRKFGLEIFKNNWNMIFTGNPGTAKTTVARLLAKILGNGKFIEVGRANLVEKYVGWTAKNIEKIFNNARGGILFIDEAYSLIDENFGSEAINEIVRQIEIFDDVILILAGYPDKMKNFLEKNEGLRSRFFFQINFPDYNADELLEIFKMMAAEKNFVIDEKILIKCRKIFEEVRKQKNFGNGRFVKNFLERGILNQSQRILRENKKISKLELIQLKPEDFDENILKSFEEKNSIGFFSQRD